jgi:hypothetical protein
MRLGGLTVVYILVPPQVRRVTIVSVTMIPTTTSDVSLGVDLQLH